MPAANSIVTTTTGLLVDRAKRQLHEAWLQPGRRSMDRLAETIVDELAQSLAALHDFRLAQVCGVPPEGAPLLDQMQQILTSLLPLGPEPERNMVAAEAAQMQQIRWQSAR